MRGVARFVMASLVCLWVLTGTAFGESGSPDEQPKASGEQEAEEEDEGFIDIDIDTNMGDDRSTPGHRHRHDQASVSRRATPRGRSSRGRQRTRDGTTFLPLFREQAEERGFRSSAAHGGWSVAHDEGPEPAGHGPAHRPWGLQSGLCQDPERK